MAIWICTRSVHTLLGSHCSYRALYRPTQSKEAISVAYPCSTTLHRDSILGYDTQAASGAINHAAEGQPAPVIAHGGSCLGGAVQRHVE